MDNREKLAELRRDIKKYQGRELTDEENDKLNELMGQAVKVEAQLRAEELIDRAAAEEAARIEKDKADAVDAARKEEAAKYRRLEMVDGAPWVAKFGDTAKYDGMSAGDVSLLISVLQENNRPVSGSAFKALSLKIGELKDRTNTPEGERDVNYVKNAFKSATGIEPTPEATTAAVKAATDPMYTSGSGYGSDWVGTAYASEIWAAIRADNPVINRVPQRIIPDGYSSMYFPLESTDPTWYKVAEATTMDSTLKVPASTITSSQATTANKQVTLAKLGARVMYTGEMVEDSLIGFVPQLRSQLVRSGVDTLEHVIVDGDTDATTSTNINAIDTTPSAQAYLVANGFRKLPLVTTTANSRSASGSLTVEDYVDTLKLMGTAGLAGADPREVAFIVDYNVHFANLKLPELKTRDAFNPATIENGFVTRMWGYQVIPAFNMHKASAKRMANTAGKIDGDTDSNNTTGAILAVRFDQWVQVFKRRMTLETTRIANADSWEIVALIRWGLAYRDTEASAITYNVGV